MKPEDELKFKNAKQSFRTFDKDLLKKELGIREISQEEWNDFFVKDFLCYAVFVGFCFVFYAVEYECSPFAFNRFAVDFECCC